MQPKIILAFESSCDDTSVALVNTDYKIIVNLVSSQLEHLQFGGILPELASRLHLQNILHLTDEALKRSGISLDQVDSLAVSINPGLIGSLLVGLSFAKSLAWSLGKPLITVNHMLAHIFANFIPVPGIEAPFLALVVSGGHTELVHFDTLTSFQVVGKSLDDAAGECFDKTAKLLGLGFPGGPVIDNLAKDGDPNAIHFPRALARKDDFNFSYSGLKTAVRTWFAAEVDNEQPHNMPDIAASLQQAIIDPLIKKSIAYALKHRLRSILLAGGVAANSALRAQLSAMAAKKGITVYFPPVSLCMDNAAMVAAAAVPKLQAGIFSPLSVNAFSQKGTKAI